MKKKKELNVISSLTVCECVSVFVYVLGRHTHLSFRMNKAPSWIRTVEAKTAKTSSLSNLKLNREKEKKGDIVINTGTKHARHTPIHSVIITRTSPSGPGLVSLQPHTYLVRRQKALS